MATLSARRSGAWMLAYQILRLVVGMGTTLGIARTLGPAAFGQYQSVVSWVLIAGGLGSLGLQSVLVKRFVEDGRTGVVLTTGLLLRLAASFLVWLLLLAIWLLVGPPLSWSAGLLVASTVVLWQAFDAMEYLFQSRTDAGPVSVVRMTSLLLSALGIVWGLSHHASASWFLVCFAAEFALAIPILFWLSHRPVRESRSRWSWNSELARSLLYEGLPMLGATVGYLAYQRFDLVLLGHLSTADQAGLYAASSRLVLVWPMLAMTVVNATFPGIVRAYADNPEQGTRLQLSQFRLLALLGWGVALPASLLSPWLIPLLFGSSYAASAPLLTVHVWLLLFWFLRTGLDRWMVHHGKTPLVMLHHIMLFLVDAALCVVWIPRLGALGAVYATIVAMAFATLVLPWLQSSIRPGAHLACLALVTPFRFQSGSRF